ncbi:MAG: hypothetical protein ACRDZ3_13880 [Acidimicrobiia bacterium]
MTIPAAMLAGAGIDWATDKIADLMGLTEAGAALAAVVIFVLTYVATKSLIKTFVAGILGGLVLFAVANPDWFKDNVGDEFTESGMRAPIVVEVPVPPSPAVVATLSRPA